MEETSPHSPEFEQPSHLPTARAKAPWATAAILAFALAIGVGYGVHQRNQAQRLVEQNQQVSAALAQTRGQIDTLSARLNEMSEAQQAREAAAAQAAVVRRKQAVAAVRHRRDDPRWKKMQSELDAQGKAIDATRQDLTSAKTELGDSIARTHGELVLLQKKGERNYYEFDIDKSKQFQRHGPVGIRLRKANTKNQYADLELMVDDAKLTQKHVNLFQPVMYYNTDSGQPMQLVINSISKNHIHGYVSEPKYRASELAAAAGSSNAPAGAATQAPPAARQKLQINTQ